MRIAIHTPGNATPEAIELGKGEELLIGRQPKSEPARIGRDTSSTFGVFLEGANISANHVQIAHEGTRVRVRDLASRNGTWLRLPPSHDVMLAPSDALAVHLAVAPATDGPLDSPHDALFSSKTDYAQGLVEAINTWLARHHFGVRTFIGDERDEPSSEADGIPLVTGATLVLETTQTMRTDWFEAVATVERYVARQNLLFTIEEDMRQNGLVVASRAMRRTVARVVDAASSGARCILLTGPSGSGKEGLAQSFHKHTGRPGPFVARNCALFSKELVRSELFGAEKGAFSGCVQRITGAVEAANAGTLFLDELGELPREIQPMLLRFLDRGEYERMGRYGRPLSSDVRIVCATNRDLRAAVQSDDFRADLWFRLSAYVIEVPPLQERFEDVEAYLRLRTTRDGDSLWDAFTEDAIDLLREHRWEGNFRELINFAERIAQSTRRRPIDADACHAAIAEGSLYKLERTRTGRTTPPAALPASGWSHVFERASAAFSEDHASGLPRTWDEVKDFVENYAKPLAFAELAGVSNASSTDDVDLRTVSRTLAADRGTAVRQLDRYFDRFTGGKPT